MVETSDEQQNIELSQDALGAINFVLTHEPYRCYDAAPRVLAILLKDGIPLDQCEILTTRSSHHFWVRHNTTSYSTADMSNFRESPITNEKSKKYVDEAITHATNDADKEFADWIFDRSEQLNRMQNELHEELRNPRR